MEQLLAIDLSAAGCQGGFEPHHAGIKSSGECGFLGLECLLDQRLPGAQFRIRLAHHFNERLQHAPELAIGL